MALDRVRRRLRSLFSAAPASPTSPLEEAVEMPCHVAYVHWGFPAPVEVMEWDLTVAEDPGSSVGEYLALFNGSIDGAQCYLGLQTDVFWPEAGRGVGKGLIFSTWWSFDEDDTRVADDGFRELGTHEGRFVGVRRPYRWTTGGYRVTLRRSTAETVGRRTFDWFDLSITPALPAAAAEWIGALRFPRRANRVPASIDPGGLLFFEVYSGARTWADVDRWSVEVMAFGDGARCPSGRTEYPRYPHGQLMPNANVRYAPAKERIQLSMGRGVAKEDPPRPWP